MKNMGSNILARLIILGIIVDLDTCSIDIELLTGSLDEDKELRLHMDYK